MMESKDQKFTFSETTKREGNHDVSEETTAQSSPNVISPTDEAFGPEPDLLDRIIPVVGHQQQIRILSQAFCRWVLCCHSR
jgi:hypothetical protein